MAQTRTRLAALVAGAVASLCVVALPAPADAAATLLKNTTYKGNGGQPGVDTTVTFTLKVGNNPGRITRATVAVHCPTASNKVVFKNVPVTDGYFMKAVSFPGSAVTRFQLTGQVKSSHKLQVSFQTADSSEPCGNYVMDGTAKG